MHHLTGRWPHLCTSSAMRTVIIPCTTGHTQAKWGGIRIWRTFLWAYLGPLVVVEQTTNITEYLNTISINLHHYMIFVFQNKNSVFVQDNAPCRMTQIVLDWFRKHYPEFQFTSRSPNSTDLNPTYFWCHSAAALCSKTTTLKHSGYGCLNN